MNKQEDAYIYMYLIIYISSKFSFEADIESILTMWLLIQHRHILRCNVCFYWISYNTFNVNIVIHLYIFPTSLTSIKNIILESEARTGRQYFVCLCLELLCYVIIRYKIYTHIYMKFCGSLGMDSESSSSKVTDRIYDASMLLGFILFAITM